MPADIEGYKVNRRAKVSGPTVNRAGIEGVTWHTLRRTFASRVLDRGADMVTVQQLLGYSTITLTMRYRHTNLVSKRAAVAKLESLGDIW